jgi:hypothetical protein
VKIPGGQKVLVISQSLNSEMNVMMLIIAIISISSSTVLLWSCFNGNKFSGQYVRVFRKYRGERLLTFRNAITKEAILILMKTAQQVWNIMPLVIDSV